MAVFTNFVVVQGLLSFVCSHTGLSHSLARVYYVYILYAKL